MDQMNKKTHPNITWVNNTSWKFHLRKGIENVFKNTCTYVTGWEK